VSLRVVCPITMALPPRGAVEPVIILRIVKAALAAFVDPGVGGGARNLAGQGKAHHENDNPLHVWPTCFASCRIQRTARPAASSICFPYFLITAFARGSIWLRFKLRWERLTGKAQHHAGFDQSGQGARWSCGS